jgi:hypothetical protein
MVGSERHAISDVQLKGELLDFVIAWGMHQGDFDGFVWLGALHLLGDLETLAFDLFGQKGLVILIVHSIAPIHYTARLNARADARRSDDNIAALRRRKIANLMTTSPSPVSFIKIATEGA